MARFFLHLHECGTATMDDLGVECVDVAAAQVRALTAAREIMCAEVKEGRLCLSCHIEVRNEADEFMCKVAFRDAIALTGI